MSFNNINNINNLNKIFNQMTDEERRQWYPAIEKQLTECFGDIHSQLNALRVSFDEYMNTTINGVIMMKEQSQLTAQAQAEAKTEITQAALAKASREQLENIRLTTQKFLQATQLPLGQLQEFAQHQQASTNQTQPLAQQQQPSMSQAKALAQQQQPSMSLAKPLAQQPQPSTSQAKPLAEQPQPSMSQAKPLAEQPQPSTSQDKPLAKPQQPPMNPSEPLVQTQQPSTVPAQPLTQPEATTSEFRVPTKPAPKRVVARKSYPQPQKSVPQPQMPVPQAEEEASAPSAAQLEEHYLEDQGEQDEIVHYPVEGGEPTVVPYVHAPISFNASIAQQLVPKIPSLDPAKGFVHVLVPMKYVDGYSEAQLQKCILKVGEEIEPLLQSRQTTDPIIVRLGDNPEDQEEQESEDLGPRDNNDSNDAQEQQ